MYTFAKTWLTRRGMWRVACCVPCVVWRVVCGNYRGLQGLYRGMAATVTGAAPYTGLKFCAYETFKISLQGFLSVEEKDLPGWMRVGAGASAGLVALTVVYPFDVIRRRMQTHRGGAKCVHLSVQCCRCNCNLHSCWHPLVGTAVHYVGVLWCVCVCMSCCHACWGCGGV